MFRSKNDPTKSSRGLNPFSRARARPAEASDPSLPAVRTDSRRPGRLVPRVFFTEIPGMRTSMTGSDPFASGPVEVVRAQVFESPARENTRDSYEREGFSRGDSYSDTRSEDTLSRLDSLSVRYARSRPSGSTRVPRPPSGSGTARVPERMRSMTLPMVDDQELDGEVREEVEDEEMKERTRIGVENGRAKIIWEKVPEWDLLMREGEVEERTNSWVESMRAREPVRGVARIWQDEDRWSESVM